MFRRRAAPQAPTSAAHDGGRIRFDGATKLVLERGRTRMLMGGLMFAIAFTVIGLRLVDMAMIEGGAEPRLSQAPVNQTYRMERADIVDRNGVIVATSLPTASLYADPKLVIDARDAARRLVRVLPELSESELVARLESERRFVWIRRHLTPQQKYAVNRLGIPGLYFQREERRVYPQGRLAAHVLGLTDVDNKGLGGVERYFEDILTSTSASVQLSIDTRVQHTLRRELQAAIGEFKALGAAGIIIDVHSGEILAMASLPDYDANTPTDGDRAGRFNRATLGVYEMGSTFKIFTTAMALESGVVALDGGYDATRPIRLAGFTIDDYKPKRRWLSVPEIFIYSSNIGAAKMALDVGIDGQRRFLQDLDLLRPASIELPESGHPLSPARWREINTATVAFGHGISISPLQLASATAAVVNGGVLRPATLLKRLGDEHPIGRQVISPRTSAAMQWLLRLAVTHGTGKRADVPGLMVGGKTGTAEKIGDRGYVHNKLLSSFVGAFPMNDPRYVVVVLVDEPKGNEKTHGYATGGMVAAPIVGRVIERVAPMLDIPRSFDIAASQENSTSAAFKQAAAKGKVRAAE
ncbi:MAG: penicillin-binding protein 2 [Alphaproteobacteria bacterium]|nr:penicillin-binding protein 2 [Alphaproteobacteria bacterium]